MTGPTPIPPDLDTEVMSVKQAARELGVNYATVLEHIHGGLLQATKVGNRFYIRRAWFVATYLTPDAQESA